MTSTLIRTVFDRIGAQRYVATARCAAIASVELNGARDGAIRKGGTGTLVIEAAGLTA